MPGWTAWPRNGTPSHRSTRIPPSLTIRDFRPTRSLCATLGRENLAHARAKIRQLLVNDLRVLSGSHLAPLRQNACAQLQRTRYSGPFRLCQLFHPSPSFGTGVDTPWPYTDVSPCATMMRHSLGILLPGSFAILSRFSASYRPWRKPQRYTHAA